MNSLTPNFANLSSEALSQRAALAMQAGAMGCFELDLESDVCNCDDFLIELFGLKTNFFTLDFFFTCVHPEDRKSLEREVSLTLEQDKAYNTSFRVVRDDGDVIWVGGRGRVVERAADGTPLKMLGVNWDITRLKAQEDRLAHLVREMNHRINNAFALMESMLVLGIDHSSDVENFSDVMCAQIHALADAHQLASDFFLHRSINAETVGLDVVLDKVMRVWRTGPLAEHIDVTVQPGLCVFSKDITPLSMILYELATNAVKYSVLGAKPGKLAIDVRASGPNEARLDWCEEIDKDAKRDRRQGTIQQKTGLGTLLLDHCIEKMGAQFLQRQQEEDGFQYSFAFRVGPIDMSAYPNH